MFNTKVDYVSSGGWGVVQTAHLGLCHLTAVTNNVIGNCAKQNFLII